VYVLLFSSFAALMDGSKRNSDTAAAWVHCFHGRLGWGCSPGVALVASSLE